MLVLGTQQVVFLCALKQLCQWDIDRELGPANKHVDKRTKCVLNPDKWDVTAGGEVTKANII